MISQETWVFPSVSQCCCEIRGSLSLGGCLWCAGSWGALAAPLGSGLLGALTAAREAAELCFTNTAHAAGQGPTALLTNTFRGCKGNPSSAFPWASEAWLWNLNGPLHGNSWHGLQVPDVWRETAANSLEDGSLFGFVVSWDKTKHLAGDTTASFLHGCGSTGKGHTGTQKPPEAAPSPEPQSLG